MDVHPDYAWLLKVFTKAANAATEPRFKVVDGLTYRLHDPWGAVSTPDACPIGRYRHISIHPDGQGLWEVLESDEGGGTCWGQLDTRKNLRDSSPSFGTGEFDSAPFSF